MDPINILVKPLITEKSTHLQATRNTYAFEVHPEANKGQIKQAVEKLYSVKVLEVRTMHRKGKPRRTRVKMTTSSPWKRALVVLGEDQRIDLF